MSLETPESKDEKYLEADFYNSDGVHLLSRRALSSRYDTNIITPNEEKDGDYCEEAAEAATMSFENDTTMRKKHASNDTSHNLAIQITDISSHEAIGLSDHVHSNRLALMGLNAVKSLKGKSMLLQYLSLYLHPFMLLLMTAAIISGILYKVYPDELENLLVAVSLAFVVVFVCTTEFYQDLESRSTMDSYAALVPHQAMVIRGGKRCLVPASSLVVGDIVALRTGDQVAADIRVIQANGLKIDSSAVTGESEPIMCSPFYDGTDSSLMTQCELDSYETQVEKMLKYAMSSISSSSPKIRTSSSSISSPSSIELDDLSATNGLLTEAMKAYQLPVHECKNIVLSGCSVVEGEGMGVVFATADRSMVGQIISLTSNVEQKPSSLEMEVLHLIKFLMISAAIQTIIVVIVSASRGDDMSTLFTRVILAIIIANVPQGLPTAVVTSLRIVAARMIEQKVYVKQLANIETLGCATVIATDKTGTLTQNKMTVTKVWVDNKVVSSDSVLQLANPSLLSTRFEATSFSRCAADKKDDAPHGSLIQDNNSFAMLDIVGSLCNQTKYEDEDIVGDLWKDKSTSPDSLHEGRNIIGDPSDVAIFNYVAKRQSIEKIRHNFSVLYHMPFNSTTKLMITVVQHMKSSSSIIILIKGAPEIVLALCDYFQHEGRRFDKTDVFVDKFNHQYTQFAAQGERVIASAYLEMAVEGSCTDTVFGSIYDDEGDLFPGSTRDEPIPVQHTQNWGESAIPRSGFTFLGLFSLADPPKITVPAAVKAVREAGVKVIMVTGDHPLTAKAIARQVGIITLPTQDEMKRDEVLGNNEYAVVATGAEIRSWGEDDWTKALMCPEVVFARTTPQQKLLIVEHLQRLEHIVCVTGDGVNDSPALKKANIGIAMGISGSDVARDAADMILLDDDFSSIVAGVKEGRLLFANFVKMVAYTLAHLWPEVAPALTSILFQIPRGISSMAVLAIDCFTELAPSIALAYQPLESDVMKQPPRNTRKDRLITTRLVVYTLFTQGILLTLVCFAGYGLIAWLHDIPATFLMNSSLYFKKDSPNLLTPNGHLYDADKQVSILKEMQTAYFMTLVMSQVGHVFLCKTRVTSLFKVGFLDNIHLLKGVAIELAIMFSLMFIPVVNTEGFGFTDFSPIAWVIPIVGWAIYLLYAEICKWFRRARPTSQITKFLGF